jgi:hypothetical protein
MNSYFVFLSIAGFTIQVKFDKSISLFGKLSIQKFKEMMLKHNEGFVLKKKPTKYDFSVEIVETPPPTIYHYKKDIRKMNFDVFKKSGNNKIITNTHISRYQFVYILKYIVNNLIKDSGFTLHGSADLVKEKANIYLGPSGAGKSTIVNILSKEFPILSDDEAYIRQEKGIFYYYQGPFLEKNYNYLKSSRQYPLGNIFIIHQAPSCEIHPIINPSETISHLAEQIWIREKKHEKKAIVILSRLIAKTKCFDLYFSINRRQLLKCILK